MQFVQGRKAPLDYHLQAPVHRNPQDARGQILVLTAVTIVALLGITALSIDASFLYSKRNRLYAAADAAAKSAALELLRGNTSQSNLEAYAQAEVTAQLDSSIVPTVECSTTATGTFGGCGATSKFVKVTVSQTTSTFFGNILSWSSATPGAYAIAGTTPSAECLIALGTAGGSATNVDFTSSGVDTTDTCTISVQGNMNNSGPGSTGLTVGTIAASGTTCTSCPATKAAVNAPPPENPYVLSSLPVPSAGAGACSGTTGGTCTPGAYTNLCFGTIGCPRLPGYDYYLNAGTYVLTGGLGVCSTSSTRTRIHATGGVTIYVASGDVYVGTDGTAPSCANTYRPEFELTAPASGTYKGIAMFGSSSVSLVKFFNVDGSESDHFDVRGVLYFPSATMTFYSSSSSGGGAGSCLIPVARTVRVTGSAALDFNNTCTSYGGTPLQTVSMAQ